MFCRNSFRLSNGVESLANVSGSGVRVSSTGAYCGGSWEPEGGDDILKMKAYTVGEAVELFRLQSI